MLDAIIPMACALYASVMQICTSSCTYIYVIAAFFLVRVSVTQVGGKDGIVTNIWHLCWRYLITVINRHFK